MKFTDLINKKLMLLEQDQPVDAAMPATGAAPEATAVDEIGANANEQVQQSIKTCADVINALVVFVNGKFSDQIDAVPGLNEQFRELEKKSTVTNVDQVNQKLLQDLLAAVDNIKSI